MTTFLDTAQAEVIRELGYDYAPGPAIAPIHSRVHLLERRSERLAITRDAVLPKLLSGELRVDEAGQLAGEVVQL